VTSNDTLFFLRNQSNLGRVPFFDSESSKFKHNLNSFHSIDSLLEKSQHLFEMLIWLRLLQLFRNAKVDSHSKCGCPALSTYPPIISDQANK
jgi:hypothetical protein